MSRKFKILSIDGGGIRGLIPAMFLEEIEKSLPEPIWKYFDLVCGTSTGGIIALAIAVEKKMSEIREIYEKDGYEIFPLENKNNLIKSAISNINMLFGHGEKYPSSFLEKKLKTVFKINDDYYRMNDSKLGVCIPSINISKGQVGIFKTPHKVVIPKKEKFFSDENLEMWNVARATSAAPTYFKTTKINSSFYIDGGLFANNPSLVGIIEARRCNFDLSEISLLSLGTGGSTYQIDDKRAEKMNLLNWGGVKGIFEISLESQSNSIENSISLLNPKEYIRVQHNFKENIGLDDMGQLNNLVKAAEYLIKEKKEQVLSSFFNDLAAGHLYPIKKEVK
ncbi:MAG: CBASS cGAMP-activated phospholipase [Candidatus Zapsychrus exili]|nr:CBASS cGAMP-activated phospholipase [Candidatus Zapsychrus exili]